MTSSPEAQPVTMTARTQGSAYAIIAGMAEDEANHTLDFSSTIYPYPTQVEALRKAGDAYRRTRLTSGVRRSLERYFRLTRW